MIGYRGRQSRCGNALTGSAMVRPHSLPNQPPLTCERDAVEKNGNVSPRQRGQLGQDRIQFGESQVSRHAQATKLTVASISLASPLGQAGWLAGRLAGFGLGNSASFIFFVFVFFVLLVSKLFILCLRVSPPNLNYPFLTSALSQTASFARRRLD